MLLSTHSSKIFKIFGEYEGIKILRNAGYDALDLTLCRMSRDLIAKIELYRKQ